MTSEGKINISKSGVQIQNIVAIDIECVQNRKNYSKMGIFAYVKTDALLNVIDSKEQYIHANKIQKQLNFILFDKDKLESAPEFPEVYDDIRNCMSQPNTIYLAHSCISDIGFISNECKNYNLPEIECSIYDTYVIIKNYTGTTHSVKDICLKWGIEHNPHECLSDANACIEMIRHISKKENVSPVDVIMKYGKNSVKCTYDHIKKDIFEPKDIISSKMNGIIICFTESFEKNNPKATYFISKEVYCNRGKITRSVVESTILIHDNNAWSRRLLSAFLHPEANVTIMSISEFLNSQQIEFSKNCFDYVLDNDMGKKENVGTMDKLAHDYFYNKFMENHSFTVIGDNHVQ